MSSGPEGGLEAVPHSQFLFLFLPVEAAGRSCLTLFMYGTTSPLHERQRS